MTARPSKPLAFQRFDGLIEPTAAIFGICFCPVHESRSLYEAGGFAVHPDLPRGLQPRRHQPLVDMGGCFRLFRLLQERITFLALRQFFRRLAGFVGGSLQPFIEWHGLLLPPSPDSHKSLLLQDRRKRRAPPAPSR